MCRKNNHPNIHNHILYTVKTETKQKKKTITNIGYTEVNILFKHNNAQIYKGY